MDNEKKKLFLASLLNEFVPSWETSAESYKENFLSCCNTLGFSEYDLPDTDEALKRYQEWWQIEFQSPEEIYDIFLEFMPVGIGRGYVTRNRDRGIINLVKYWLIHNYMIYVELLIVDGVVEITGKNKEDIFLSDCYDYCDDIKPVKYVPSDIFFKSEEWRQLRYKALKKHGGKCQLCGKTRKDGIKLHVDHIKPRSKFPALSLDIDNLQILCEDCNLGKSNKDDTDWRGEK
jgi:hypothetical protein